ncbi:MAG: hypothetical protein ABIE68_00890 [bacterium]
MSEQEEKTIDLNKIGNELLSWEANEFVQYDRDQSWYLGGGILAVLLVIYSIFTSNYLFTLIIAMIVAVVYLYTQKKPEKLKVVITEKGIVLNKEFLDYEDLEDFWILYKPPELKTLNIGRQGFWRPHYEIQLEDINPLKVREILLEYLEENVEREEGGVDRMSRNLKF